MEAEGRAHCCKRCWPKGIQRSRVVKVLAYIHTGHSALHALLECPALGDLRSQYAPFISESSGIMARLVWADDQPLVSKYIIACLDRSEVH